MDNDYRTVLGHVEGLRRGITTGTCAQAASLGAATMLLSGQKIKEITVTIKDGRNLTIPLHEVCLTDEAVECCVIKDAGDDDDITHGKLICSRVVFQDLPGITIHGGKGVGRVTKKGLPVAVGQPAINPNPIERIQKDLSALAPEGRGFSVTISVPEGEQLARKTWNPRLGIEGGISIIGTSGVVEPKSQASFKASIELELKVLKENGLDKASLAFGYVGQNWYRQKKELAQEHIVKFADHFGFALDMAAQCGFGHVVIAGHIGKMAKVASGLFDTHWSYGDARLETVAAWAGAAGAPQSLIREILELKTAEEAVGVIDTHQLHATWTLLNKRLLERCRLRLQVLELDPVIESVILDMEGRELACGTI